MVGWWVSTPLCTLLWATNKENFSNWESWGSWSFRFKPTYATCLNLEMDFEHVSQTVCMESPFLHTFVCTTHKERSLNASYKKSLQYLSTFISKQKYSIIRSPSFSFQVVKSIIEKYIYLIRVIKGYISWT
jgi:hypothetical protein